MKKQIILISICFLVLCSIKARTINIGGISYPMILIEGTKSTDDYVFQVPDFYIGKTEVTVGLWRAVMGENSESSYRFRTLANNIPVSGISLDEIDTFIDRLNKLTNRRYRLPNSIEWQYAFQEGKKFSNTIYSGSDDPDVVGWYSNNSRQTLRPVAEKKPNALGIYDMSGNVSEICRDGFTTEKEHYWFNLGGDYLQEKDDFKKSNENITKGLLDGSLTSAITSLPAGIRLVCDSDTAGGFFPASYLAASETRIEMPSRGGSKRISVSTDGSSWDISYLPEWCKVSESDGGLSFTFICIPNDSTIRRDWFIINSGYHEVIIDVIQAAKEATYLNSETHSLSFKSMSETKNITVNTDGGAWEIQDLPDWCSVNKSGNRFALTCMDNKGTARNARIKVNSNPKETYIDIHQSAVATYLDVSENKITFLSPGGSKKIKIMTDGDSWKVSAPWWCKINKENDELIISCPPNKHSENSGIIEITSGNEEIRILVTQKGAFNSPKGERRLAGFSIGYTSKQWEYKRNNNLDKYGAWDEYHNLNGMRFGVVFEPLFKYGFGLSTGLFFEYYHSETRTKTATDDIGTYDFYCVFSESSFYIPLHLQYRLYFSRNFNLFFYGGISADIGLLAQIEEYEVGEDKPYFTEGDVYGNADWGFYSKRFNTSLDFGAGIRIYGAQVSVGISKGLINHSNIEGLSIRQNKNIAISLAWMIND